MNQRFDFVSIPSSLNVNFTISKCRRKLFNLQKFVKSHYKTRYRESLNNSMYLPENNSIENQCVGSSNFYRSRKEQRYSNPENNYLEKKNLYLERNSELCSESSISYNNSFINKMIERYKHSVGINMKSPSNEVEIMAENDFKHSDNICSNSRKSYSCFENNQNSSIYLNQNDSLNRTYLPKIDNSTYSDQAWKKNQCVAPERDFFDQFSLETREMIKKIEMKIEKLENKIQSCSNIIDCSGIITDNYQGEHIYARHYKRLESKIISMAMFPPRGVRDYESSFIPYYCTFGEIDALKEFISVNMEFSHLNDSFCMRRVGKMYCYFARERFVDFVKCSPDNINSLLKLKLLFFLGEPEMLLVNTFGQYPIEVEQNYDFCECNATNELENILRFLVCLVAIEADSNYNRDGVYPIYDVRRILPIYIIDNS